MEKRYYWLKLKNDFFTDKRMKKLRKIAGGDTYTIIYLKMQLLSLQDEGMLYFENIEDTFEEEIALQIDEDAEDVRLTIAYLERCGLLNKIDNSIYELIETKQCIGSETRNAESMRKLREKRKENVTLLQNVTNCYTEKEIEKEIEKDINIYSPAKAEQYPYDEIINYLNEKVGTHYRSTTPKTRTLIKARFKEGFTLDDFKNVIEKKEREWKNTNMEQYLRPQTLFGTLFESYLNAKEKEREKSVSELLDEAAKNIV